MLRKLLITGALALTMSGVAAASSVVSYTTTLNSTATDVLDLTLAIQKFDPTLLSLPFGSSAVLQSFTVTLNQTITTSNLLIENTGASTANIKAQVDTLGLLYLFNPTPAGNLPLNTLFPPSDDAFGGAGPNPSYSQTVSLGAGLKAGPFSKTASQSATTGVYSDGASLALVQANWNAYLDTLTNLTLTVPNGNGNATFNNFVSGSVTVNYTYDVISGIPEPASVTLLGSALVGLGLLVRRRKQNNQ